MEHRLRPGDQAPDLELLNQDGETRSLAQLHGQSVILYFFPKAFTPGCTTEVCNFRDTKAALAEAGYTVLGVSADPPSVLREFADAHQVNHDLLSDPDHESARRWGAWGPKEINGRPTIGPLRSTFVVDDAGQLESVEYNLDAASHVAELGDRLGLTGSPRAASAAPDPSSAPSTSGVTRSAEPSPAPLSHVRSLPEEKSEPT